MSGFTHHWERSKWGILSDFLLCQSSLSFPPVRRFKENNNRKLVKEEEEEQQETKEEGQDSWLNRESIGAHLENPQPASPSLPRHPVSPSLSLPPNLQHHHHLWHRCFDLTSQSFPIGPCLLSSAAQIIFVFHFYPSELFWQVSLFSKIFFVCKLVFLWKNWFLDIFLLCVFHVRFVNWHKFGLEGFWGLSIVWSRIRLFHFGVSDI